MPAVHHLDLRRLLGLLLMATVVVAVNERTSTITQMPLLSTLEFFGRFTFRGCPIFVHRVAGGDSFVLEPTFCLVDRRHLLVGEVREHRLRSRLYIGFPVMLNSLSALSAARRWLNATVESVEFMQLLGVEVSREGEAAFCPHDFLTSEGEAEGFLRIECDVVTCSALRWFLRREQTSVFDSVTLKAEVSHRGLRQTLSRRVFVANGTANFEFFRRRSLPGCGRRLQPFSTFQFDDCVVHVHRRLDRKGEFVLEPMLCRQRRFSVKFDCNSARYFVSLVATVKDDSIVEGVIARLAGLSPSSVKFMELEDVKFFAGRHLSRWEVGDLRMSAESDEAEIRIFCSSRGECERLRRILQFHPVDFWRDLRWRATSKLDDSCSFVSRRLKFPYRMRDLEIEPSTDNAVRSHWSFQSLKNKIVVRGNRKFIVFHQRDCSNTVSFARNWSSYEKGFGDDRNFWLGLSLIHSLTGNKGVTMRVELTLWNQTSWHAEYLNFTVKSAATNYTMWYSRMDTRMSTLIFDAMAHSRNNKFSTMDRDNDHHDSHLYCSPNHGNSGWWFNSCTHANPNGMYHSWYQYIRGQFQWKFNMWQMREGPRSMKESRMMLELTERNADFV